MTPKTPASREHEVYVAPSREARWLLQHAAWLVSPPDGHGSTFSRFLRMVLVAPFTQLSFVSFDLQDFLFRVFHRSALARTGHLLGMLGVNFFVMAGLARVGLPGGVDAALVYALLLLGWYLVVARAARLHAWWLAMVPVVLLLQVGARAWSRSFSESNSAWVSPWTWVLVSAATIMLSHSGEALLPPRAARAFEWTRLASFLGEVRGTARLGRALRIAGYLVWGTLDELWASPRLLPYNVLHLLFAAGYAPRTAERLRERATRAWTSGNPALDYVGTGGGAFLPRTQDR
jgi:hypothetical protein